MEEKKKLPYLIPVRYSRLKKATWVKGVMFGDYGQMIEDPRFKNSLFIVNDNGGWGVTQWLSGGNAILRDYVNSTWAFLRNKQQKQWDYKNLNYTGTGKRFIGVAHKITKNRIVPPFRAFGIPTGSWKTTSTSRRSTLHHKLANRHKKRVKDDINYAFDVLRRIICATQPAHIIYSVDKTNTTLGSGIFSSVTHRAVFKYIFSKINQLKTSG